MFARHIVGWLVSASACTDFVLDALEQASYERCPLGGNSLTIILSAGPSTIRYTERTAEAGIESPVGSVSDSHDNALAETINGPYKAHRRGPWRNLQAVEMATLEGWTGSITGGYSNPSATFHPQRLKPLIICNSTSLAWPRD